MQVLPALTNRLFVLCCCSTRWSIRRSSSSLAWLPLREFCSTVLLVVARPCWPRPLPTSARQTSSPSRYTVIVSRASPLLNVTDWVFCCPHRPHAIYREMYQESNKQEGFFTLVEGNMSGMQSGQGSLTMPMHNVEERGQGCRFMAKSDLYSRV